MNGQSDTTGRILAGVFARAALQERQDGNHAAADLLAQLAQQEASRLLDEPHEGARARDRHDQERS